MGKLALAAPVPWLWDIKLSLGFGSHVLDHSLHLWINDGLMAVFFFVNRALSWKGSLWRRTIHHKKGIITMLPPWGGCWYRPSLLFNKQRHRSEHGGDPMAPILPSRWHCFLSQVNIPSSVKVFLSALAVADDLGAVLVIAIFYSSHIDLIPLL